MNEKWEDDNSVEAYGVMGLKRKQWRKIFKSIEAMNKWADDHDAEILGSRNLREYVEYDDYSYVYELLDEYLMKMVVKKFSQHGVGYDDSESLETKLSMCFDILEAAVVFRHDYNEENNSLIENIQYLIDKYDFKPSRLLDYESLEDQAMSIYGIFEDNAQEFEHELDAIAIDKWQSDSYTHEAKIISRMAINEIIGYKFVAIVSVFSSDFDRKIAQQINQLSSSNNGRYNGSEVDDNNVDMFFSFENKDDFNKFREKIKNSFSNETVTVQTVGAQDVDLMGVN